MKPHKLLFLFLALLITAMSAQAVAPVVSNIRASQRAGTKLVDIYYDVADASHSSVNVTVEVSSDAGASYSVPAATFTGDFGPGVAIGAGKHVVWNAGIDWNGMFTTLGRVRVMAENGGGPPNMAFIPGSYFQMGDNFGVDGNAVPVHSVYVSDFYLEKFEVTKELWEAVYLYGAQHGYDTLAGSGAGPKHPVQTVSWYDVVKWCNARSEMEGRAPVYYTDTAKTKIYKTGEVTLTEVMVKWTSNGYRLPTEAEWEKAARGGLANNHFPWSSVNTDYNKDITGSKANYASSGDPFSANAVPTTPVGYYNGKQTPAGTDMANAYGLYDMAGNVWEWCWDWYGSYTGVTQQDPRGATSGLYRVIRGGSWSYDASYLRCAVRGIGIGPGDRSYSYGFRCALSQP